MIEFIEFLRTNAIVIVAISSSLTVLGFVLAPLRLFHRRRKRPDRVEIVNPEALNALRPAPVAPSQPIITLTLEQFEARLARREAEIRSELEHAHSTERTLLKNQLDELFRQKIDPEEAMQQGRARIQDLEARLQRESNELGGEGLRAAQDALAGGDASLADALFAEIEARTKSSVQSAARAAFARGEIAEGEVRWADAAKHFYRAANLDPTVETYFKAHEFAWRSGDYQFAGRFGEDLVALARKAGDKSTIAKALNAHATTLNLTGKRAEAEALFREILELDRETIGTAHPEYSKHVSNLAHVFLVTGRLDEAETLFREALEVAEGALGPGHQLYAQRLNNLAEAVRAKGRYDEAEALYRRALEIDLTTVGRMHPSHSTHLNNLAETLMAKGAFAEAEALLQEAEEIKAATLGKGHPYYAHVLNNLGHLFARLGRWDEARAAMRSALETREMILGGDHPDTVSSRESLEAFDGVAAGGGG